MPDKFPGASYDKKVYVQTPPEIIDFIESSIDHILKTEFSKTDGLNARDIHIIDPFAGEGQFTLRGLDSGIITPETAARIEHMEVNPERADLARKRLREKAGRDCHVRTTDTLAENPKGADC